MELLILSAGGIRCLYAETILLTALGRLTIRRASYVEPDDDGQRHVADQGSQLEEAHGEQQQARQRGGDEQVGQPIALDDALVRQRHLEAPLDQIERLATGTKLHSPYSRGLLSRHTDNRISPPSFRLAFRWYALLA